MAITTEILMISTNPTMKMVKGLLGASNMELVKPCVLLAKIKEHLWVVSLMVLIGVACVEREDTKSVYPAARRQANAAANVGCLWNVSHL